MIASRVGTIAEKKFELECIEQAIPISKPILDVNGYDFIVEVDSELYKIQVKSKFTKSSNNVHKINLHFGHSNKAYCEGSFDFAALYIDELSLWYIIPYSELPNLSIDLRPMSKISKFNKYINNWKFSKE